MTRQDIERIENVLWVLEQYNHNDDLEDLLKLPCRDNGISIDHFFGVIEDTRSMIDMP